MKIQIAESVTAVLNQLGEVIGTLTDEQFTRRLQVLSGASLGEHVRHVIEFFQELEKGFQSGRIHYDARRRDRNIEINREYALLKLREIVNGLRDEAKTLFISCPDKITQQEQLVQTSYERELLYNIEHAVHHMALIKIGIRSMPGGHVPDHFGVAASTIEFRQATCAQ